MKHVAALVVGPERVNLLAKHGHPHYSTHVLDVVQLSVVPHRVAGESAGVVS